MTWVSLHFPTTSQLRNPTLETSKLPQSNRKTQQSQAGEGCLFKPALQKTGRNNTEVNQEPKHTDTTSIFRQGTKSKQRAESRTIFSNTTFNKAKRGWAQKKKLDQKNEKTSKSTPTQHTTKTLRWVEKISTWGRAHNTTQLNTILSNM